MMIEGDATMDPMAITPLRYSTPIIGGGGYAIADERRRPFLRNDSRSGRQVATDETGLSLSPDDIVEGLDALRREQTATEQERAYRAAGERARHAGRQPERQPEQLPDTRQEAALTANLPPHASPLGTQAPSGAPRGVLSMGSPGSAGAAFSVLDAQAQPTGEASAGSYGAVELRSATRTYAAGGDSSRAATDDRSGDRFGRGGQAGESAGAASTSADAHGRRPRTNSRTDQLFERATRAYERAAGERGLALWGTGISYAV